MKIKAAAALPDPPHDPSIIVTVTLEGSADLEYKTHMSITDAYRLQIQLTTALGKAYRDVMTRRP